MPNGPRLIHILLEGCDGCPFRAYEEGEEDGAFFCRSPLAEHFLIVGVGGWREIDEHGNSVESRLGQPFPASCPLPYADGTHPQPHSERTRVISLPDTT